MVHRLVGRAQPARVPNRDHAPACDHSREGHDPFARAEHRLTQARQEVDAAVTRCPLAPGLLEAAEDRGPGGQRPDEALTRRDPARASRSRSSARRYRAATVGSGAPTTAAIWANVNPE